MAYNKEAAASLTISKGIDDLSYFHYIQISLGLDVTKPNKSY